MKEYVLLTCFAANLAAQTTLDVHVYDWANVPVSTLDQTSGELARVFRVSGIQIRWIVEPPDSPEAHQVVLVDPPRPKPRTRSSLRRPSRHRPVDSSGLFRQAQARHPRVR